LIAFRETAGTDLTRLKLAANSDPNALHRDVVISYLTSWGIAERETNHCGWQAMNIIYKIMRGNLVVPVEGSDIEYYKVRAVTQALNKLSSVDVGLTYIMARIFVDKWSFRKISREPVEGRKWSKSEVGRLKEKAIAWLAVEMGKS